MAKIYTRTGDEGETSLMGGGRVRKDSLRIETIGSVDEVNAALGMARNQLSRARVVPEGIEALVGHVQHQLFNLGAELADVGASSARTAMLGEADIAELEREIDYYEGLLEPLREFILPGGSAGAAQLHVARGVCRRAERRLVELAAEETVRGESIRYLNRLSDLLFVLARAANQASGVPDVKWQQVEGGRGKAEGGG